MKKQTKLPVLVITAIEAALHSEDFSDLVLEIQLPESPLRTPRPPSPP